MQGTFIKLGKGICPIIASAKQQFKLTCCLTQRGVMGSEWVWPHCYQAKHPLSFNSLVGCYQEKCHIMLEFSALPHVLGGERAYSSASVISLTLNCNKGVKVHVTPIPPELSAPIGQHPQRSACSHSLLLLSVIREGELVSEKVAVPKYLGETLAVIPQCLPPATW